MQRGETARPRPLANERGGAAEIGEDRNSATNLASDGSFVVGARGRGKLGLLLSRGFPRAREGGEGNATA